MKRNNSAHTSLYSSLLLRPCPTYLYSRSILDFDDQRSYPVPLARQEHAFDSIPALSKSCKVQHKRYATLVFNDFLQPPEGMHRTLIPRLVQLAVRTLEPTTPTAPPTTR